MQTIDDNDANSFDTEKSDYVSDYVDFSDNQDSLGSSQKNTRYDARRKLEDYFEERRLRKELEAEDYFN